jgi:hypothetical protein
MTTMTAAAGAVKGADGMATRKAILKHPARVGSIGVRRAAPLDEVAMTMTTTAADVAPRADAVMGVGSVIRAATPKPRDAVGKIADRQLLPVFVPSELA